MKKEAKKEKKRSVIRWIRNTFNRRREWKNWWTGDRIGAAFLHSGNQHLRVTNSVSGEMQRKKFFEKELESTKLGFGKIPSLPTWIIIVAEIEARIKEIEQSREEKRRRFLQHIRANTQK